MPRYWCAATLGKIDRLQTGAGVLYPGKVLLAAAAHLGQFFPIRSVGHRDGVRALGEGGRQVEVVVGDDEALVLILEHVAVCIVQVMVAHDAGGGRKTRLAVEAPSDTLVSLSGRVASP